MNLEIIDAMVQAALAEDVGSGDVSAMLIPISTQARAKLIVREPAVLCGRAWMDCVYHRLDDNVVIDWHAKDGQVLEADQVICEITGSAPSILTGERCALNFLQTLSATATVTHRYAQAIAHTNAKLLDTRKTIPGLRYAQKYAVSCGGGVNHRQGLYDAFLLKENHLHACGSIAKAVAAAKQLRPDLLLQVEVETMDELQQALSCDVTRILLDNFDLSQLKQAVAVTADKAQLEASGGVDLQSIVEIAETGVDFISVGGLTKNIQAIDLSLRFI